MLKERMINSKDGFGMIAVLLVLQLLSRYTCCTIAGAISSALAPNVCLFL